MTNGDRVWEPPPWEPSLAGSELEHLVGALDRLPTTFRWKAGGLYSAGLQTRIGASSLTLGGRLKHLAAPGRAGASALHPCLLQRDHLDAGGEDLLRSMRDVGARNVGVDVFCAACDAMITTDVRTDLERITSPMLAMVGSEDCLTLVDQGS